MSTLYISTSGSTPSSSGVWRVSSTNYQYNYNAFTPGEDINLDQVSISTFAYDPGQSAPNNFQVGLYRAGVDSLTPGSLITYLSGPSTPVAGSYNTYTPTESITLTTGTQYWLGFTLFSDTGGTSSSRVKISTSSGSSTYLGSGWSVGPRYLIQDTGSGTIIETGITRPATFQLYGRSAVCFCSGTGIKTPGGERKIDEIQVGDIICTSAGDIPVKWVAKRAIKRHFTPREKYEECLPIRIESGSLGNQLPHTDLLVSEFHGIHTDGKIVNAAFLVNNLNIYKETLATYPEKISYFHLEFEDEVLIWANGVEACSYVNRGNRRSFDNYHEFISLYVNPDLSARSLISHLPRDKPSLEGHKGRVKRSWQTA